MTKHSSRLILKILHFAVNGTSELVLRNKIRFVTRIRVDLTVVILVIVLSTKCSCTSPYGYCFAISFSIALLITVLGFLFQHPLPPRLLLLKILLKNMFFLLAITLLNFAN